MWRMCTKSAQSRSAWAPSGARGEIEHERQADRGLAGEATLARAGGAPEVVAGRRRRATAVALNVASDLVDDEVRELGHRARAGPCGRARRSPTTSRDRTPGCASTSGTRGVDVRVDRTVGHLEVQPGRVRSSTRASLRPDAMIDG